MEIKAKVIINTLEGHYGVARVRNEGIRHFLESIFPELKDWYLGTINALIISPQGINIRTINTSGTKEVDIPQILYLKHTHKHEHNNEEYLSGEIWRMMNPERMKLVPVTFKINGKTQVSDGFLYIPSGSPHPENGRAELIAKEKLCDKYKVQDGDEIIITVNQ